MSEIFSLSNPVFSKFALYSSLVLGKTLFMGELIGWTRVYRQAFATEEDVKMFGKREGLELNTQDRVVERLRSIHLNDLENVFPFVLVGMLYVSTKPGITESTRVFQIFAASRILHSIVYASRVPQPARALTYVTGYGVTFFMLYKVVKAVW